MAVRQRQGGGCGKRDVLPPTQSTKKILLILYLIYMETIRYKKLRTTSYNIINFMEIHQNT